MKKQILIYILICLIVIIGLGAFYFYVKKSIVKVDNKTVQNQAPSQQKENNRNALPQVKKLNCEDIAGAKEKENCLAGVVKLLNSDNSSVCAGLTAEADKSACRQSYIIKEAANSGDLTKCQAAASAALAADCRAQTSFSLAIQKKDKKYCENIINKTDKENCFKVLAGMGIK